METIQLFKGMRDLLQLVKEDLQTINKHMKRCLHPFHIIRDMQLKTTMKNHCTLLEWSQPRAQSSQMLVRMWDQEGSFIASGKHSIMTTLEHSMRASYKTKPRSDDLAVVLPQYVSKVENTLHTVVQSTLFIMAKTWKHPRCSSINKEIKQWWCD